MAEARISRRSCLAGIMWLLFYLQGVDSLKILKFQVPLSVNISQKLVDLHCRFDMEGRNLFAVKWYKDEAEFYRYMPNMDPKKQHFNTTGISLDMALSNNTTVYLNKLQYATSGSYRCEISTDGPDFHSVSRTKNLTVMALPPLGDPRILINKYVIGENENLEANCTTLSNPPAELTWYINDAKAESWLLNRWERQLQDSGRRYYRSLALKFTVNRLHFSTADDKINLTCAGVIPGYQEPLVTTRLVANLHKTSVAAQGSHFRGAGDSAVHGLSWVRVLLLVTFSSCVAMSCGF